MKIVLISGPPRCGKDTFSKTLGEMLADEGARVIATPLACVLKCMTHGLYAGMRGETVIPKWNHFEETKEEADEFFNGKTPRQAYIDMHEEYIRPILGNAFIAKEKVAALTGVAGGFEVAIIPDLGNVDQLLPFTDRFDDVIVVRMLREGKEWSDNRKPIPVGRMNGGQLLDFVNNDTIEDMRLWIKQNLLSLLYAGRK